MNVNPQDPLTFFLMVLAAALVLTGAYFFLRETFADALALHEKRKEQQRERDRREGKIR